MNSKFFPVFLALFCFGCSVWVPVGSSSIRSGGQLLSSTLNPLVGAAVGTVVNGKLKIGDTISYDLANGTAVYFNGTRVDAGAIGLGYMPDILCAIPGVNKYITCLLCNDDCLYAHNSYGGLCTPSSTIPNKIDCKCAYTAEDAKARNITTDSKATCGAQFQPVNAVVDNLFFNVVRGSVKNTLCPTLPGYNGIGCTSDCIQTHGVTSGNCVTSAPKVNSTLYKGAQSNLYCECA